MNENAKRLSDLLSEQRLHITPCCCDALSARLIELAGFEMMFMSGFGVSADRLGLPDTGLISFGEMLDQARNIRSAVSVPVIADGDTGYGNALNVKRTIQQYSYAGLACVMIEDQVAPKRCGHTQGKQVVDLHTACHRIEAAVDAREESDGILIMARTDALASFGIDEAIKRARAFRKIGADLTFVEAPQSVEQMKRICDEIDGPKMANQLEGGLTPLLPPAQLAELGFAIAAYPFTLLMAAITSMQDALAQMKLGVIPPAKMTFAELKTILGFDDYYQTESKYAD